MAKMKRATKRTLFITVVLVVILTAAFTAFYLINTKQLKAVYQEELKISQDALEENSRQLYVATTEIKRGDTIDMSDVSAIGAIASIDAGQFFSASDIGSVALVDIPAETVIMSSMITYETYDNTLRESEFGVIVLNSNLTNGEYVDVRIRYANGEDYIVLSQKRLKNISLKNAICYMDMTEEETQLMSSAIVDAGVHDAVLYTTTYLESGIQTASEVTYQPRADVLRVIFDNPNIVEVASKKLSAMAREEMELRLKAYEESVDGSGVPANILDVPTVDGIGNTQGTYAPSETGSAETDDNLVENPSNGE